MRMALADGFTNSCSRLYDTSFDWHGATRTAQDIMKAVCDATGA